MNHKATLILEAIDHDRHAKLEEFVFSAAPWVGDLLGLSWMARKQPNGQVQVLALGDRAGASARGERLGEGSSE